MTTADAAQADYLADPRDAIRSLDADIGLLRATNGEARQEYWSYFRSHAWPQMLPALALVEAEAAPVLAQISLVDGRGWESRARELRSELRRSARAAGGLRVVPPPADDGPIDAWRLRLDGSKTARQAALILEHAEGFAGLARLDQFRGQTLWRGEPITDTALTELQIAIDDAFGVEFSIDTLARSLAAVASRHAYNALHEAREAVSWDGLPRLNGLLRDYFGAGDSRLVEEASRILCLSAIARGYDPGCKADNVVILVGPQGARKSTGIRALAGATFYSDSEFDPGSRDGFACLRGVNIYELAEFEKWNSKRDAALIKAFITSQRDRYRPAYARYEVDQPRALIFVGSSNVEEILHDATGDRRFLPVRCCIDGAPVDVPRLERDAPQIWAEALARYRAGERWHIAADAAELQAADAEQWRAVDPWAVHIADFLAQPDNRHAVYSTAQLLEGPCGLPRAQAATGYVRRVNQIMRNLGFTQKRPAYGAADRSPRWYRAE